MRIHFTMSSLPEIPKPKKFDKHTLNMDHDRIKRNILEFCNIEIHTAFAFNYKIMQPKDVLISSPSKCIIQEPNENQHIKSVTLYLEFSSIQFNFYISKSSC